MSHARRVASIGSNFALQFRYIAPGLPTCSNCMQQLRAACSLAQLTQAGWVNSFHHPVRKNINSNVPCHGSRDATCAPRSQYTCVYSSIRVKAPPRKVRMATEESNRRAKKKMKKKKRAATGQHGAQQTALQKSAQTAGRR